MASFPHPFTPASDPAPPSPEPEDEASDARPADDDARWRGGETGGGFVSSHGATPEALKRQCDERIARAVARERPKRLIDAIRGSGCTALRGAVAADCVKAKLCPAEEPWAQVGGFYNAQKSTVYVCAEKEPSEQRVEDIVTHELVHAYDHCRNGVKLPWKLQAPWALTCGNLACSEVRAYLLGSHYAPGGDGGGGGAFGGFVDDAPGWGNPRAAAAPTKEATPEAAAETRRNAVYVQALASIEGYQQCLEKGADCRRVLDAVFNACIADHAPFGMRGGGGGGGLPPMPDEGAAADAL